MDVRSCFIFLSYLLNQSVLFWENNRAHSKLFDLWGGFMRREVNKVIVAQRDLDTKMYRVRALIVGHTPVFGHFHIHINKTRPMAHKMCTKIISSFRRATWYLNFTSYRGASYFSYIPRKKLGLMINLEYVGNVIWKLRTEHWKLR